MESPNYICIQSIAIYIIFCIFAHSSLYYMPHIALLTFNHIPFLRLLLPLATGIVIQYIYNSIATIVVCGILLIVCGILTLLHSKNRLSSVYRRCFFLLTCSTMAIAGMISYNIATTINTLPTIAPDSIAIARVDGLPTEREHSYQTHCTIIAINDSTTSRPADIPILLNIEKSHTARSLQGGELILFHPDLQPIEGSAIPHAFDYARHMALQGTYYRQYLRDDEWQHTSHIDASSWQHRALRLQSSCINNLYQSSLTHEQASFLSALLWGYKANIPESTRQIFSVAGLSHILAVSGLHTGIIAFILWLLLYPLRWLSFNHLREIIALLLLWGYAFVTGLSPSVVRACTMATFIGVAHIMHRRNTSLNALCGSAVIVLLAAPAQLFDIGFQLSYTAVAGILLLSPYLDIARLYDVRNNMVRYVSGSIAVTLAAQLATTPLAAHYFHIIPIWGLISNIFLLPLLPLLILSALVMQLCVAIDIECKLMTMFTQELTNILLNGAQSIASLPIAHISNIAITPPMLVFYSFILIAIWYALSRRSLRPLTIIAISVIAMQAISLYYSLQPSTPMAIVPAERSSSNIQLSNASHNCIIITTDTMQHLPRNGEEWRIMERLSPRIVTHNDTIAIDNIYTALPFIQYYYKRMLWVDDNSWRYCSSDSCMSIDYAFITEQYTGHIAPLLNTFDIDSIILSATIFKDRGTQLQNECQQLAIGCYNIATDGAWIMPIPDEKEFD